MKGILIDKVGERHEVDVVEIDERRLPQGEVIVRIDYSTINYKDALAITGKAPVARKYPMIPGIDFAGTVEVSDDPRWEAGDQVILNGWGVGESHWGGLAQRARVKGDWLIQLPQRMTPLQAMAIGTAGYTAMLCVMALQRHGASPADGDILVTGAVGGVGSIAIAILAGLGYSVVASTGRLQEAGYLKSLGAASVFDRSELSKPGKPLAKERWSGAVDCVGGQTLANVCASMFYGSAVAACGLAGGMEFPATVAPFILRGVTLYGIDSVMASIALRQEAWDRLASELDHRQLDAITSRISSLSEAISAAPKILAGQVRGRLVVNVNGQ